MEQIIRRACSDRVACTTEHKLAVCMSFIRAVHLQDLAKARHLQKKCRELREVHVGIGCEASVAFSQVKDATAELMQLNIKERADELKSAKQTLPMHAAEHQNKSIASLLHDMLPAGAGHIAAIQDQHGNIVQDVQQMADIINAHWQQTFTEKATNADLRKVLLKRVRDRFKCKKKELRPTREDVKAAINESVASAAGPDCITFDVYKKAGSMAVSLFFEVANAMIDGSDSPDDSFNVAFMVCLPKEPDSATP